ncbi:hypothetical protein GCM10025787_14560 [Saccharopolyspora rosea]
MDTSSVLTSGGTSCSVSNRFQGPADSVIPHPFVVVGVTGRELINSNGDMFRPDGPRTPVFATGQRVSGLEAVTHAGFGEQVARAFGRGFQLAAQLGHVLPEVVGFAEVARPPDLGEQLPLGDQLARVVQQDLQQPPFGGGEVRLPRLREVKAVAVAPSRFLTESLRARPGP